MGALDLSDYRPYANGFDHLGLSVYRRTGSGQPRRPRVPSVRDSALGGLPPILRYASAHALREADVDVVVAT